MLHAREAAASAPAPSEQLLLFDYGTAMFHRDPGDPESERITLEGFGERVARNGHDLLGTLRRDVLGVDAPRAGWILLALVLLGFLRGLWGGPRLLDWFAVAYTGLLLTYFTYDERLALPLIPFVYLYGFAALRGRGTPVDPTSLVERSARLLAGGGILVLLTWNCAHFQENLDPREQDGTPTALGLEWSDAERLGKWFRENTPRDAVILCHQAPVLAVLSDRRAYTYRFPRSPELVRNYDPDYVVFYYRTPLVQSLEEFIARIAKEKFTVPCDKPGHTARIYRLSG
jgi:hypothetical protein